MTCLRCQQLDAEIDRLTAEVERLKAMLPEAEWQPPRALDLTPGETRLVRVLLSRTAATGKQIYSALYAGDPSGGPDPKVVHTTVYNIRRKMRAYGLGMAPFKTGYRGYYLPEGVKNTLLACDARVAA
jgi:DNA-binding response OmpR family regulator